MVVESTQKVGSISRGSDFNKLQTSLADIVAPSSSSLGMVCCLMGATLVLEQSNWTSSIFILGAQIDGSSIGSL